jgi:hypothetical protein
MHFSLIVLVMRQSHLDRSLIESSSGIFAAIAPQCQRYCWGKPTELRNCAADRGIAVKLDAAHA